MKNSHLKLITPSREIRTVTADLLHTITFAPRDEPQVVWSKGGVKVSAIRSTHVVGHASYRVDTPAGSVVIGGDAGNDIPARPSSTSEQVEKLAKGADVIVHSTIHPVLGPEPGSGFFPHAYYQIPIFERRALVRWPRGA